LDLFREGRHFLSGFRADNLNGRGAALAIHGSGGSMGDIFGPIITGLLLSMLPWRSILSMYFVLPLIMAVWIFWAFFIFEF